MATPGVGGYSCDFVLVVPEVLMCPTCQLTLCEPFLTDCCGRHFCQTCISPIRNNKEPCPLCQAANFSVMIDQNVKKQVNQLLVHCDNHGDGCVWEGKLGKLEKHHNEDCGYTVTECSLQCGKRLHRRMLEEHEADHCPNRSSESQIRGLMVKLDSALAENLSLSDKNKALKAKVVKYTHRNEQQAKTIKEQAKTIKEQDKTIKDQAKTIKDQAKTIEDQSPEIKELQRIHLEQEKKKMKGMSEELKAKFEEKACPVCNTRFPARFTQLDFERHVEGHFQT